MEPCTWRRFPRGGVFGSASCPCSSAICPLSIGSKQEGAVVGQGLTAPLRSMLPLPPCEVVLPLPVPPCEACPLLLPAQRGRAR